MMLQTNLVPTRYQGGATEHRVPSLDRPLRATMARWQQSATHHEGSWWPCWEGWPIRQSSERVPPPAMGNPQAGYAPLCDAPGTYVLEP